MVVTFFCRKPREGWQLLFSVKLTMFGGFHELLIYYSVFSCVLNRTTLTFHRTQLKLVEFQTRRKSCLYHLLSDSKIGQCKSTFSLKRKSHQSIFGVSLETAIWEIINQLFSNIRSASYESIFNENIFENVSSMKQKNMYKRAADI